MTLVVGLDTETHLIAEGDLAPRLVCATFDLADAGQITPTQDPRDTYRAWCSSNADPVLEQLLTLWQQCFRRQAHVVIQNAAFDQCVIMRYCMDVQQGLQAGNSRQAADLYHLMWEVMDQNLEMELSGNEVFLHDTLIREKLWNLSTIGSIDSARGKDLSYSLGSLVKTYFGVDISDGKVSTDAQGRIYDHEGKDITGTAKAGAAWRLRYRELDGIPSDQWPPEARQYAIDDASWARKVWECQEGNRRPAGPGSMNSASLQVYADTALRIYSMPGFVIDRPQVDKMSAMVNTAVWSANEHLRMNGIVRPNGTVDTKALHARIEQAWALKGRHPMITDTGRISASGEVLEELAGADPVIDVFAERQQYIKLQTSFLPNLAGTRVWSNYDILKETGRTSSYGNGDKSTRRPLYPAVNIQQIPRQEGVRECFLPPPPDAQAPKGYFIVSCDYSALELCSVAQVTYTLFGFSVHREKINLGYDAHTFLGSGMAMRLDPDIVDRVIEHEQAYQVLDQKRRLKVKSEELDPSPEGDAKRKTKKTAGKWRNFAKPVGLGYPGGLGPPTLVTFAKATYGIEMDEDQATVFRDMWRQIYPEMPMFFDWVNKQIDPQYNSSELYCYETQGYNRFRAAATFCATANGKSMQSLSADGAKRSVCWLARACSGGLPPDNPYSLLSDCLPLAFIHDENLIAVPDDELATERCLLISQLMVEAMQISMPDVLIKAEPALMRRWTKAAEPEWKVDAGAIYRVHDLLQRKGQQAGVFNFADIVADAIPNYDPTNRLLAWDDVNRKQA